VRRLGREGVGHGGLDLVGGLRRLETDLAGLLMMPILMSTTSP
jgi:hypothetical protein